MPETLGPYELLEELGSGAQGTVWRARHRATGASRAVKRLAGPFDPESVERFRREAQALARAGGAAVTVHEIVVEPGELWYAMELCPGGSLERRLEQRGRFEWRDAVSVVAKVARALDRCHEQGLLHRDLKPANVLFDEHDEPRLADWGLVKDLARSRLTETGMVVGTPAYMAPEQLAGRSIDGRADVFALGV
ncbi:MAG TPA: serine/threonine-protein kinase, partial [Planctomycetota bacterium]|nr:serine/threonine-protein kinase [Planctomycetota bacterium]